LDCKRWQSTNRLVVLQYMPGLSHQPRRITHGCYAQTLSHSTLAKPPLPMSTVDREGYRSMQCHITARHTAPDSSHPRKFKISPMFLLAGKSEPSTMSKSHASDHLCIRIGPISELSFLRGRHVHL